MTSNDDLQEAAATWLIRLDAGTADTGAFEAWRSVPRHAVAFAQAQAAWETMSGASRNAIDAPHAAGERNVSRRMLLRAASVVVPAIAVGGGALLLQSRPAYATTAVGEQRRFSPRPGLKVELNTDSRIGWRDTGSGCELWLERGEAALLLERSGDTTALLHCAGREAVLLPGIYNVRSAGQGPELLVIEGGANVSGNPVLVKPGEAIHFDAAGMRLAPASSEMVEAAAAWRRGEIVFSGQRLGDALAEYNRYLDHKLVAADPSVASLRVGGRFETARPESFLKAIQTAFDLEAVRSGGEIVLRRKNS